MGASPVLGGPAGSRACTGQSRPPRLRRLGFRPSAADRGGQLTLVTLPATGQNGPGSGQAENVYLYPGGPLLSSKVYNEAGTLVRQVDTGYDAEGRTLSTSGSTEAASSQYDGAGRLFRLFDGSGNLLSEYHHNTQGQLAFELKPQPGGGYHERAYSYDLAGRVTLRSDGVFGVPTGRIEVGYLYDDPDGLLTDVLYAGAPGRNVHLAYDGYGRLATRTDGTGSRSFSYGSLDQVLSVTTQYTGLPAQTLTHDYYPDGSRAQLGTPVGSFQHYYNAAGQPTSLVNPFNEVTAWDRLGLRDDGTGGRSRTPAQPLHEPPPGCLL